MASPSTDDWTNVSAVTTSVPWNRVVNAGALRVPLFAVASIFRAVGLT